jgi:hypothetical protein
MRRAKFCVVLMVLVLMTTGFSCKAKAQDNSAVEQVTIGDYSFAKIYWEENDGYAYIPYGFYVDSENRVTTLIDIIKKEKVVSQAEADDIERQLSGNPNADMEYGMAFSYLQRESDVSDDDKYYSDLFLEYIQDSYRHYLDLLPKNAEQLENVKYIIKDCKRWKDGMSYNVEMDIKMGEMDLIRVLFPRIKNKVLFY